MILHAQERSRFPPRSAYSGAYVSRYEKLHAWRECHELALAVYRVTKRFPDDERYGLTSQTRRAAFSAAVNIVEGSARRSTYCPRRTGPASATSKAAPGFLRGSSTKPWAASNLPNLPQPPQPPPTP